MMRNKPASSMQKTYDECYLICSTAVYFEGQNNEAEALRSWRSALDQIYYHNAYRIPANYTPKTETEKALFTSLKELEMQCKERVDLLEALKQSRKDVGKSDSGKRKLEKGKNVVESPGAGRSSSWLGEGTIPPVQYPDLSKPAPPIPQRPTLLSSYSSETVKERAHGVPTLPYSSPLTAPPTLAVPAKSISRSPSPDKDRKTMRTTLRDKGKKGFRSSRGAASSQAQRPAPMKAAGMAWDTRAASAARAANNEADSTIQARLSASAARKSLDIVPPNEDTSRSNTLKMPSPTDYIPNTHWRDTSGPTPSLLDEPLDNLQLGKESRAQVSAMDGLLGLESPPPPPPPHAPPLSPTGSRNRKKSPPRISRASEIQYRKEYPRAPTKQVPSASAKERLSDPQSKATQPRSLTPTTVVHRKPLANSPTPRETRRRPHVHRSGSSSGSRDDTKTRRRDRPQGDNLRSSKAITPPSTDAESPEDEDEMSAWDAKVAKLMKNLPKGVDENAAKQILNEIVVKGDEVHWDDVAGLEGAKKALKEAVVYPFLRPDLFMGLREPARGMLLFGPPGTGKTMLARAVATESKSTFFAISASSLTSKWHGESEKLVRALFALAKAFAPSIIFVDEIDSLLSARSSSTEHEASRRSKTEFLIQWSDLQRAAAGRDTAAKGEGGDASRVLVLAATNVPWDIDDAARRRFVRRQYIPLPEPETREVQLCTLLGHQKHDLSTRDVETLAQLTDGFSGSDITALAKDAAMGPLRKLGEALLYTPMDQIRPIQFEDFVASLVNIRPSVSKQGLQEFEEWAREFGERGG